MTTPPVLIPNDEHPITVTPSPSRVRVVAKGHVVADTTRALSLQESSYPAVFYVPLSDVDDSLLRRSDTASYCPYKGTASYYDVVTPDGEVDDAIWEYQQPHDAVAEIAGHVAFYPDRVDIAVD